MLAEVGAMSHKGPLWVPDYDNIRKRREEEVSAGSWLSCEGLRENQALTEQHIYVLLSPPWSLLLDCCGHNVLILKHVILCC